MKCAIGCGPPAIGIANLAGKPGTPTAGTQGTYPLCAHHYSEAAEDRWGNVVLEGWEPFPENAQLITDEK